MADSGSASFEENSSRLVWNCPAPAIRKSLETKFARYLSMSKLPENVTVTVSSTTARDRDSTVTAVLPRLRPRFAHAMDSGETVFARRPAERRLAGAAPSV